MRPGALAPLCHMYISCALRFCGIIIKCQGKSNGHTHANSRGNANCLSPCKPCGLSRCRGYGMCAMIIAKDDGDDRIAGMPTCQKAKSQSRNGSSQHEGDNNSTPRLDVHPPRANRNLPTALSIARRILAGKTQETTWPGSTRKIGWRPNELLNAAGIETSHHNIPGISWQMQKSCSTSRRKECLARVPANTASRLLHSSVGNAGKFLVFPASISRILVSRDVWISGMAGIQIN